MADWDFEPLGRHLEVIESGCRPRGGVAKYSDGVPSISAEQIREDGEFVFDTLRYVPHEFYASAKKGKIQRGDILVVKDGATTGKTAFVDDDFPYSEAMVNEHTFILRTSSKLVPKFAFLCLQSEMAAECFEAARGHGIIGGLTQSFPNEIEIPVLPLAEQRRLVGRIEELTGRLAQARQARQSALTEAEKLTTARISAMFPDKDCWRTVKEAVSNRKGAVRSGPFGSQLHHSEFTDKGVAAIGTRDVHTNYFELRSGWFVSKAKFESLVRYRVFPGDVLCTIVGASIGRFCVVPDDVPLAFTTKHVQALTLDPNAADPHFVSYMLNFHPRCRDALFCQVDGSAQPSLNATKVLATALPLPPVPEQKRIADSLTAFQTKLDELRRLQREVEMELTAFVPALLAKAFRGEL